MESDAFPLGHNLKVKHVTPSKPLATTYGKGYEESWEIALLDGRKK